MRSQVENAVREAALLRHLTPVPPRRPTTARWLVTAALLILATLTVFGPAVTNSFVEYDDHLYVTHNEMVRRGLSAETVRWAFTTTHATNWHPLTWLSHLTDAQLFGLDPRGHHLTSVLLHTLNAVLMLAVGRALTGSLAASATAAALFALHPLRVESVAWVSERKDVLSAFWFLFGILCAVAYARTLRLRWYAATLAAYILGLLAKPMLVTFPLVLLLLDYWPLGRWRGIARNPGRPGRRGAGRLLLEKVPLLLFSLTAGLITLLIQWTSVFEESLKRFSVTAMMGNAVVSLFKYWGKTLWPLRLAYFYPHPGNDLSPLSVLVAVFGLALITVLAVAWRNRCPWLALGWSWYLVTILPVIGIVQVGAAGMADRYTYIPFMGPALAMGVALAAIPVARRRIQIALFGTVLIVAMVAGFFARRQVVVWKDTWSLTTHALAVTRGNWMALDGFGSMLARQMRWEEAAGYFYESIRHEPTYFISHLNLGKALLAMGDYAGAAEHFAMASRLNPHLALARIGEADARNRWGMALAQSGRTAEALVQYDRAIAIWPDFTEAHANRGRLLVPSGWSREASASPSRAGVGDARQ